MKPAPRQHVEIEPGVFRIAPIEPPKHIGDLVRAEIARRDWSKAMIWADRQKAVRLPEHKPWRWW